MYKKDFYSNYNFWEQPTPDYYATLNKDVVAKHKWERPRKLLD